ncbi:MAG: MarR family transcriptional regulator [Pseudomonadota bacterium]
MAFQYTKTASYRLNEAYKAERACAAAQLATLRLQPGQELVLKALVTKGGRTMSDLAQDLGVEPPTVTAMVTRLATHGYVVRQTSPVDGRLSQVFLTNPGRAVIADIDRQRRRVEKAALAGFTDKDKRKLRKLLRKMEKNLSKANGRPADLATALAGDGLSAPEA